MNLMSGKLQGIIQPFFKRKPCLQQRINVIIITIQTPDSNREEFHAQSILCNNRLEIVVNKTGMQGGDAVFRREERQLDMVAHIEQDMLRP